MDRFIKYKQVWSMSLAHYKTLRATAILKLQQADQIAA